MEIERTGSGGVNAKTASWQPPHPYGATRSAIYTGNVVQRVRLAKTGSPYLSGGMGASLVTSPFYSDWDPTLSIAGGTGVRLTERLGVVGELRIRGHQFNFAGSTADISAGLAWQLSSL